MLAGRYSRAIDSEKDAIAKLNSTSSQQLDIINGNWLTHVRNLRGSNSYSSLSNMLIPGMDEISTYLVLYSTLENMRYEFFFRTLSLYLKILFSYKSVGKVFPKNNKKKWKEK